jgi:hypothetical protein
MTSKQPTDEGRSVRGLIDLQRRIVTLLGAGALDRHLGNSLIGRFKPK